MPNSAVGSGNPEEWKDVEGRGKSLEKIVTPNSSKIALGAREAMLHQKEKSKKGGTQRKKKGARWRWWGIENPHDYSSANT